MLVVSGSWIEGIYSTSQIIIVSKDKEPFIDILVKQEKSLHKLIKVLDAVKDNEDIKDIYAQLVEIKKVYETIEDKPTTEQIDKITKLTEDLRNSLVQLVFY